MHWEVDKNNEDECTGIINNKNNAVNVEQVNAKIDAIHVAGRCAGAPEVYTGIVEAVLPDTLRALLTCNCIKVAHIDKACTGKLLKTMTANARVYITTSTMR